MPLKLRILAIGLLYIAISLATFYGSGARLLPSQGEVEQVQTTAFKALSALRTAENSGADISELAIQFNAALSLLQEAKDLQSMGDISNATKVSLAASVDFTQVSVRARQLQEKALAQKTEQRIISTVLLPVGAFAVALCSVLLVRFRRWMKKKQLAEFIIRPR